MKGVNMIYTCSISHWHVDLRPSEVMHKHKFTRLTWKESTSPARAVLEPRPLFTSLQLNSSKIKKGKIDFVQGR